MSNSEKYSTTFKEAFMVDDAALPALAYQSIATWDSVGHMALMAALEETFGVELDIDDIIEFSSFEVGKAILKKYDVTID